jgi:hypothetical protein
MSPWPTTLLEHRHRRCCRLEPCFALHLTLCVMPSVPRIEMRQVRRVAAACGGVVKYYLGHLPFNKDSYVAARATT